MSTGPGLLFVVSGPSGAGKDTLVEALRGHRPGLRYSVSATTREPRADERKPERTAKATTPKAPEVEEVPQPDVGESI